MMASSLVLYSVLAFFVCSFSLSYAGRGFFKIKFIKYERSGGLDVNGTKCDDGLWGRLCDTYFKTTFRHNKRTWKFFETMDINNKSTMGFGNTTIGKETNTLQMNFTNLQGPLEYWIEVWDHDSADAIDALFGKVYFNETNKWQTIKARNPGRLSYLLFNATIVCYSNNDSCIWEYLNGRNRSMNGIGISTSPTTEAKNDGQTETSRTSTEKLNFLTGISNNEASTVTETVPSSKIPKKLIVILAGVLAAILVSIFSVSMFIFKLRRKSSPATENIQLRSRTDYSNDSQIARQGTNLTTEENPVYLQPPIIRINNAESHVYAEPSMEKKRSYRTVEGSDNVESHVYADPSMEKKRSHKAIFVDVDPQQRESELEQLDVDPKLETPSIQKPQLEREVQEERTFAVNDVENRVYAEPSMEKRGSHYITAVDLEPQEEDADSE